MLINTYLSEAVQSANVFFSSFFLLNERRREDLNNAKSGPSQMAFRWRADDGQTLDAWPNIE